MDEYFTTMRDCLKMKLKNKLPRKPKYNISQIDLNDFDFTKFKKRCKRCKKYFIPEHKGREYCDKCKK